MGIKDRIKKAKNWLAAGAGAVLLAGAPTSAQGQTKDANKDQTTNTTNTDTPKQYIKIVELNSLSQMKDGRHNAAEYNDAVNAVIYTQFSLTNANKEQQLQIDATNAEFYSVNTENHEANHAKFSQISRELYNGTCVTTLSDRVRCKIMEEIICKKAEKGYSSIVDAIDNFKKNNHTDTYAAHYGELAGERIGSALVAMIAEDKIPENLNMTFIDDNDTRGMVINGQEYCAQGYVSKDKKFRTFTLHKVSANGEVATMPEAAPPPCKLPVNVLCSADGQIIKGPNGKPIKAVYDEKNATAYGLNLNFKVANVNKEKQGYDFSKAKQNFDTISQKYAKAGNLNAAEAKVLKEFVGQIDLGGYDLTEKEIKEIRDNYKNTSFEELQQKAKTNYQEVVAASQDKFNKQQLPYLIPVQAPSRAENMAQAMTSYKASQKIK